MNKALARNLALNNQLDSYFDAAKQQPTKALPLKSFTCVVMSTDPTMFDEEDNHQKYQFYTQAESKEKATQAMQEKFKKQGLPVFWIRVYDENGKLL